MRFTLTTFKYLLTTLLIAISFCCYAQHIYMRNHLPWGTSNNDTAFNAVFGPGNWKTSTYTVPGPDVFNANTKFVYMEGGENNDTHMNGFLNANRTLIENWVAAGGNLFMNSAGWNTSINYGFGGVQLIYGPLMVNVLAAEATHPVFLGPFLPTANALSGNYYAHDYITGSGLTPIIRASMNNQMVLASKPWGNGFVVFGGITSPWYHQPKPQAQNLWQNIIQFASKYIPGPQLKTDALAHHNWCAGSPVSIGYTASGTFNPANEFIAELSDASGSFANSVVVGKISSTTSGVINGTIPEGTLAGTGYRVRVVSTAPAIKSTDNGTNINIRTPATFTTTVSPVTCPGGMNGSIIVNNGSTDASFIWNNPSSVDVIANDFNNATHATPVMNNVSSLSFGSTADGYVHSHSGSPVSFTIDLYNATAGNWVTVYSSTTSSQFNFKNLTINFPTIPQVTQLRFTSNPKQEQSFHNMMWMPISFNSVRYSIDGGKTFQSSNAFSNLAEGTYPVVVDDGTNCVSKVQQVAVLQKDEIAPVLNCASAITVKLAPGSCIATLPIWVNVSDNCSATVTYYLDYGNPGQKEISRTYGFTPGKYTVTAVATDNSNNQSKCSYLVTVEDIQKPVITTQPITLTNDAGQCGASKAGIGLPVVTDNCTIDMATLTNDAPAVLPVGETTINWSVKDINGNVGHATQKVTVADKEAPELTCGALPVLCFNATGYQVPKLLAADNCGIDNNKVVYAITGATNRTGTGYDASGSFNAGTSILSWSVSDIHGNTSTCQTTVVVNEPVTVSIPDVKVLDKGVDDNTVYIGYNPASAIKLTALADGGSGSFTYAWSDGSNSPSITAHPTANTVYSVTVTDALGCSKTASITVKVVDVRSGNKMDKVLVCQVPAGNPANAHTISISSDAVATHLANGAYLGACKNMIVGSGVKAGSLLVDLNVAAMPNPSAATFTLRFTSTSDQPLKLRITDLFGRVLETRENIASNSTLEVGRSYKAGTYIVEVIQGMDWKHVKLIKTGN